MDPLTYELTAAKERYQRTADELDTALARCRENSQQYIDHVKRLTEQLRKEHRA